MADKQIPALAKKAAKILDATKGENIVLIDVRQTSSVTDYHLLVTGSSAPHLKALSREIQHALKHEDQCSCRQAGDHESGWIILDYSDIIMHIFSRRAREYYAIEELLAENPQSDLLHTDHQ